MRITSSSISSSEPGPAELPASWRSFALAFVVGSAVLFSGLLALVAAVDPYDGGRLALLRVAGLPAQAPRTAHASRARDPAFDAAILGNSHVQLLSPDELTRRTGMPFLSLAVPGTGPRETFALLDYFLRHRARPARALVIGIDPYWCRPEADMPTWYPFPFWLYERSVWRYLAGLARFQSLEGAQARLSYALGFGKRPRARPDGYWNYDEGFVWQAERHGPIFTAPAPTSIRNETGRFPALDALADRIDALPRDVAVILLRPPVHEAALAASDTVLGRSEETCRAAALALARTRPSVALVDWRVDRPETRDPHNFMDLTHYRSAVARTVERDVAEAIGVVESRIRAAVTR